MIKRKRRLNKAELVKTTAPTPDWYVEIGDCSMKPRYLMWDKQYLLSDVGYDKHGAIDSGHIVDDEGDSIFILIDHCSFLGGGSWHLTRTGGE